MLFFLLLHFRSISQIADGFEGHGLIRCERRAGDDDVDDDDDGGAREGFRHENEHKNKKKRFSHYFVCAFKYQHQTEFNVSQMAFAAKRATFRFSFGAASQGIPFMLELLIGKKGKSKLELRRRRLRLRRR
jgi:hypothetical protein